MQPISIHITNLSNLSMMVAEDISALNNVIVLTSEMPETDEKNTLSRMIFANGVSILETYLFEVLNYVVFANTTVIERLISAPPLKERKLDFKEVYKNPNIVEDQVRRYLSETLYHKLDTVRKLYQVAVGVDIFPDEALKQQLQEQIKIRHDLVHRNGRNKAQHSLAHSMNLVRNVQKVTARVHAGVKAEMIRLDTAQEKAS